MFIPDADNNYRAFIRKWPNSELRFSKYDRVSLSASRPGQQPRPLRRIGVTWLRCAKCLRMQ